MKCTIAAFVLLSKSRGLVLWFWYRFPVYSMCHPDFEAMVYYYQPILFTRNEQEDIVASLA